MESHYREVGLITVAFNNVPVIDWQIKLIKKFWPEALHVIVDNSSDSAAADKIKQISRGYLLYIKVPNNPFVLSESHGAALNWACKNVVGKLLIRYVGFSIMIVFQ